VEKGESGQTDSASSQTGRVLERVAGECADDGVAGVSGAVARRGALAGAASAARVARALPAGAAEPLCLLELISGTNSTLTFRDPAATNSSRRFYRAVTP